MNITSKHIPQCNSPLGEIKRGPQREPSTIRAFTKKELALMYFPESNPRTAVNHLMAWIRRCTPLWDELLAMGYHVTAKSFTPREVRAIMEYLGEP